MEFQFQDVKQGFTSPDFLYNFEPAGDLAPKYKAPPAPNSVENLAADYIQRQRQVSEAVQQQHRIDSIYERVMNEAPRRDVEVLPPEDPAEVFNPNKTRMKNITPVEQQQEISDLLERQVKRPTTPSVAEPPVTPSYKTIPLTDPMATPPTFTPRQPVGGTNPAPGAKPSGLPFPAGRLAAPLVGGAIDFGFRVVAGQPLGQAAAGAVGSTVGSVVGGTLGSAVGPVGTFVGGLIGGFVGGAIADFIYNSAFPPTASVFPPPVTGTFPFNGGQTPGVLYYVKIAYPGANGSISYSRSIPILGKITAFKALPGDGAWICYIYFNNGIEVSETRNSSTEFASPYISDIYRADGQPDTGGNPAPNPIPSDDRTPNSYYHPGNSEYAPPTGAPSPVPAPNNYAPGGFASGGTQRGDSPDWVPHGFPAPKSNPNPNTTPGNLGSGFPSSSPNLAPSPSPSGVPSPSPSPNPPGYRLDSPGGKPSGSPSGSPGTLAPPNSTPNGLPTPTPQTPPADGFKPVPQPQPQPQPEPTPPQTDICESPCIQSMGQEINKSSIFWVDLQVPIVICSQDENGIWKPQRGNQAVKVIATSSGNEVAKTQIQFEELAKANEELCNQKNPSEDAYLVTPEWWQVRSFQRPQLVIQYANLLPNNKLGRSRWATTIPHYNKTKDYKPKFPQYEKGNFEGILVLKDNSKIIINAKNKTECIRVLESFKTFINSDYLKDIKPPKIGERPGVYKEVAVVAVYAHFFQDGQKDNVPTWSIKLRDKK